MKRLLTPVLAIAFVLGVSSLMVAEDKAQQVVVVGIVTDSGCGAAGEEAGHDPAKCVKEKGAKWAIYDEANKKVYVLSNQDMGPKMMENKAPGKKIKVKGMMDPKTNMVKVTEWNWA